MLGDDPEFTLASARKPSDSQAEKLTRAFTSMMSALYKEEGASLRIEILGEPEVQDFIDTHASILDSSFSDTTMSDTLRERLSKSNWLFSGLKTFDELGEAFPSLLTEDGARKPFEQFLSDVQSIDETYNSAWLRAEYNFAGAAADMAARWEDFADEGDGYLLQYRTAGDDKVRPEHAALNGVTLPRSDSFWDSYYPPNGWNCRCTVVEVLASKYPATDHNEAMQRGEKALSKDTKGMFRFNPGKQERTFPAYNPYTIRRCNGCNLSELAGGKGPDPNNPLCQAHLFIVPEANQAGASARIQKYDKKDWDRTYVSDNNRGLVVTEHRGLEEGKRSKNERAKLEKELRMCKVIADNGHDVELLRIQGRPVGQSYDILLDGVKAELKCITGSAGNMYKRAKAALSGQGAEAIVFEIPSRHPSYYDAITRCRRMLVGDIYFYVADEKLLLKAK